MASCSPGPWTLSIESCEDEATFNADVSRTSVANRARAVALRMIGAASGRPIEKRPWEASNSMRSAAELRLRRPSRSMKSIMPSPYARPALSEVPVTASLRGWMGVEPTAARSARPATGFEDQGGHQAPTIPLLPEA